MKRVVYISGGLVIVLLITFCSLWLISARAETKETAGPVCYYTSIRIDQGETLNSIAKEYNTSGFYSDAAYIDEIKRININYYVYILVIFCYNIKGLLGKQFVSDMFNLFVHI